MICKVSVSDRGYISVIARGEHRVHEFLDHIGRLTDMITTPIGSHVQYDFGICSLNRYGFMTLLNWLQAIDHTATFGDAWALVPCDTRPVEVLQLYHELHEAGLLPTHLQQKGEA